MLQVSTPFLWVVPISAAGAIVLALLLRKRVTDAEPGNEDMVKMQSYIKEGANAFIKRQYVTLAVFVIGLAVLIGIAFANAHVPWFFMVLAYIMGAVFSGIAGWIGLAVGVSANSPTAWAAHKGGMVPAFNVSFFGGAVMGLLVTGMGLLGVWLLFFFYEDPSIVLGFSFGASSIALFMKAGGGIYTKTADVGADLVGKIEFSLPEDDVRNPATIADNVGDNVGDIAGMGADLLDSYIAAIVASMLLGFGAFATQADKWGFATFPLVISAGGLVASVVGIMLVGKLVKDSPGKALNLGTYISALLYGAVSALFTMFLAIDSSPALVARLWPNWLAGIFGVIAGLVIGLTTDYFTDDSKMPTQLTAKASQKGHALNILTGLSFGLMSIAPPLIGIVAAMAISWFLNGVLGVANAAVGMLAIVCTIVSNDAYGPITDNARGLAEQGKLEESVIAICDKLDSAGNTAKAITKGFAIGAGALTVLALLYSYSQEVMTTPGIPGSFVVMFDLLDVRVMIGALIGAGIPPVYSAFLIRAVDKNAGVMVDEIRRQFKEMPGILEGTQKADYAKCVDIATKGALKELIIPSILSIGAPLFTGIFFGVNALGAFLATSIATGFIFGLFMGNAGGMWDNAKKYVEDGNLGGKGSPAHAAAVTGDTVGDPLKDTAGPSINTLIVVMGLTSTMFLVLFAMINGGNGLFML